MDNYLKATEGLLGVIQAVLNPEELEKSAQAGEEMYEEIKRISNKYELNIQEMLNATLGIHYTIIEVANEQIEAKREELKQ